MIKYSTLNSLATFFVLLGALNWGLVGIFDYNLVSSLLGEGTLTKVTYVLIGFFAVFMGFNTYAKAK